MAERCHAIDMREEEQRIFQPQGTGVTQYLFSYHVPLESSRSGKEPEFPSKILGSEPVNIFRHFIQRFYNVPKTGGGHLTIKNSRASRRERECNAFGNIEYVPGPGRKDYRVAHTCSHSNLLRSCGL